MHKTIPARPVPELDLTAAGRLRAAFAALAAARRGHATVIRIDEMHAVLSGRGAPTGGEQR